MLKLIRELIRGKTILEIRDDFRDTWTRIEHGDWRNEKELNEHIKNRPGRYETYYKLYSWEKSNIPENYKYQMFDFHERYPSAEARNQKVKEWYDRFGWPAFDAPIII
jgi:hypothetical protein